MSISTSLTYYLKTPRLDNIKVSDTLPLSYQDIGQDFRFRVNPSEETQPCITQRLSLTEVIQEKRSLKLEPTPVLTRPTVSAFDLVSQTAHSGHLEKRRRTKLFRYARKKSERLVQIEFGNGSITTRIIF